MSFGMDIDLPAPPPWRDVDNLNKWVISVAEACLDACGALPSIDEATLRAIKDMFWRWIHLGQRPRNGTLKVPVFGLAGRVGAATQVVSWTVANMQARDLWAVVSEDSPWYEAAEQVLGEQVLQDLAAKWRLFDCLGGMLPKVPQDLLDAFAAAWSIGAYDEACEMAWDYMKQPRRRGRK